jgi:hypothetical protein
MTRLETQLVRLKSAAEKVHEMTGAYYISSDEGEPVVAMVQASNFAMLPGAVQVKSTPRDSEEFPSHKLLTIKGVTFEALFETQPETKKDGE